MITIQRKNHSFLKIKSEPSVIAELSDALTYQEPGYEHSKLYKKGIWDGRKRLYDGRSNTVGTGSIDLVEEFAKARGYRIEELYDPQYGTPRLDSGITPEEVYEFVQSLNIQLPENGTVRDYQYLAIFKCLKNYQHLLLSPTASGKSLIIYCCLRWILDELPKGMHVHIIVPTVALVKQMYSDFEDYGWDAEANCHMVKAGQTFNTKKPVIITTWQSLVKRPNNMDVYGVFGDEGHNYKADSFKKIMGSMVEAKWRIGTTGTLNGVKVHKLIIQSYFGSVVNVAKTHQLIEQGHLAQLDPIEINVLKYSPSACHDLASLKRGKNMNPAKRYQTEQEYIITHAGRNQAIINRALELDGNTLILFERIEKHGKVLYEMLEKQASRKRPIYYIDGGVDGDIRDDIRVAMKTQKNAIVIASYGTTSTGINIPTLDNLVLASGSKSNIRVLQSIGRILRKSPDGRNAKVIDFADDLTYRHKMNYALSHAVERMKIYSEQKFPYILKEIKID